MKTILAVGLSVICVLLTIIAIELHGMRPVTSQEWERIANIQDPAEQSKALMEHTKRIPMVSVQGSVKIERD